MAPFLVMWVHLIAVVTWIGGLLFVPLVLKPALRGLTPESQQAQVLRRVGLRFRTIAWVSLITLILTGAFNMLYEGGSARLESTWGAVLMLKLLLVAIAVGLTLVHDFILDPYASSPDKPPQSAATGRVVPSGQAAAMRLEQLILALNLAILLIASYLARM
jgi:uncharacterized membrane protein